MLKLARLWEERNYKCYVCYAVGHEVEEDNECK
jgi:hypothetical protein